MVQVSIKLLLLITIFSFNISAQDSSIINNKKKVLKLNIKQEIGPAIWRQTMQAFEKAENDKVDYILIHMNTYGGLVESADSIRTKILNSEIPVFVFIDNNAASAGALIAISCDSIYMRPGANIGAATVVNQSGEAVPDKYQSYMRSTMRSTAEAHGKDTIINGKDTTIRWFRDPKIAEAMVDPRKRVEGVSDSGEVLTFTASEALKHFYCEGTAENIEEVLELCGINEYTIDEYTPSQLEKTIGLLVSPYLQGILIMIIIGGIYFELQTPGVGFPIAAAILASILYFAPLYLEGIAENWEILLFAVGIILMLIEIFVIPGFGLAGISGIILAIAGLTLSMSAGDIVVVEEGLKFNLEPFAKSLFVVLISMFLAITISLLLSQRIVKTNLFARIALNKEQDTAKGYIGVSTEQIDMVGEKGVAFTVLKPSGKVLINNEIYDAKARTGYIEEDEQIEVVSYGIAQLYVKKI
ncbi:MAG: serine protease [Bacteroidetes bacterium 4572_117]|nr:MAG: serine protease [Bacteroidetes bacterium 4572_117]